MEPETETEAMKQRANTLFRCRVLAANAAHVPRAAFFGESVFIHVKILLKKFADGNANDEPAKTFRAASNGT
jgi:hypothetical protein